LLNMPVPDPNGLDIEEHDDGSFTITAEIWPHGNRRHRIARMKAVTRRLRCGGWRCRECKDRVPLYKRADAHFCSERCRKLAARRRHAARQSYSGSNA
jgi:hypothetical protein